MKDIGSFSPVGGDCCAGRLLVRMRSVMMIQPDVISLMSLLDSRPLVPTCRALVTYENGREEPPSRKMECDLMSRVAWWAANDLGTVFE